MHNSLLTNYNLEENSTFRYTCEKYDSSSSVSLSPERSEAITLEPESYFLQVSNIIL